MFGWFAKKPKTPTVDEMIAARRVRLDEKRSRENPPRTVEADTVGDALDMVEDMSKPVPL